MDRFSWNRHTQSVMVGEGVRRRGLFSNADTDSKDLREFCRLDDGSQELLRMASEAIQYRTLDRNLLQ